MFRRRDCLVAAAALAAAAAPCRAADRAGAPRRPDVVFVPTPRAVVDSMLEIAGVGAADLLYDLGSGDGRIPIAAAKRFGARALGIDLDPMRVRDANANAAAEGVTDLVRFVQGDLFELDLRPATVITLYLLPELNLRLRPTLLRLKAGTRVVSHDFAMGDWKPDRVVDPGGRSVYLWTVPPPGRPYPRA